MTLTWPEPITPPAGNTQRFGGRWRLVGAGLSNVWRYGDLELPAPSGRLLLRGPNGTGKTTALEVLWPYLLDLNQMRLAAGKARNTHLSSLMRESAEGRRRVGYVWLSFTGPGDQAVVSYGVRLNFSEGGTPPVRVTPFSLPGRPLHELALWAPGRATLSVEQFGEAVTALGGTVFDDPDEYVRDLATRVFATDARDLALLAERIRQVRNPALLGELSPREAADALRASLPGVNGDVIEATGEALAESDATRKAFEDDRAAADALDGFARVWAGHAVDVTATYHQRATEGAGRAADLVRAAKKAARDYETAQLDANSAVQTERALSEEQDKAKGRLAAIEQSDAYRAAGRLSELAATVASLGKTAAAHWDTLGTAASQSAQMVPEDIQHLTDLAADITAALEPVVSIESSVAGLRLLDWVEQPRTAYRRGDRVADPGPVLTVTADDQALEVAIASLQTRAADSAREGELARTFVTAHHSVAAAAKLADDARREAGRLAKTADEQARYAKARAADARHQGEALGSQLHAWVALVDVDGVPVTEADLAEVAWDEPAVALAAADDFERNISAWISRSAERSTNRAEELTSQAQALRDQASVLRAEAAEIHDGHLLPLPRPEWAGPADDTHAFGAALEWRAGVDQDTQDTIEVAMAAAGLLGATLSRAGAERATWRVNAVGDPVEANLSEILDVDVHHPLADAAAAVLARVALAPTANAASPSALAIGRDGTFRFGVLAAAVPAAKDQALRSAATHIGALRRRGAALAYAAKLEAEAEGLDIQATALDGDAEAARVFAAHVRGLHTRFPRRDPLRDAESARVAAAQVEHDANEAASKAERHADELTLTATQEQNRWAATVTAAGLPADVDNLTAIANSAKSNSAALTGAAHQLDGRLRGRIASLVAAVASHDTTISLDGRCAEAADAFAEADMMRAKYDELRDQVGKSPEEAVARHEHVKAQLRELGPKLRGAGEQTRQLGNDAAERKSDLRAARNRAKEAGPVAAQAVAELRALLLASGVSEAILDAEAATDDADLLAQVAASLAGKDRYAKRTLRERADETRAKLAGVWSVDPGPDHPELDTYLLTHSATSFTPLPAAGHARLLADRAEEALRAADEQALREFVIGRLPAAVAQTWTRLFDWVSEVNTKMKSASASSGVGVAVRVSVKSELPALVRTVYELACKTGAALRDPDAKTEAGRAIHQLINAADGDDMASRVRDAVDVRDWVDVTYQVTRPGEEPKNWGSRTGLSGGERRLVVLAPMLAAVAAAYDKFPPTAVRLAALDELPSEVDEEGREGLARYIAELDLDLIATSHHWDGAPGAWDGIDAHDLESAPDGTVVAFPMLVRGLQLLPGDTVNGHDLSAL